MYQPFVCHDIICSNRIQLHVLIVTFRLIAQTCDTVRSSEWWWWWWSSIISPLAAVFICLTIYLLYIEYFVWFMCFTVNCLPFTVYFVIYCSVSVNCLLFLSFFLCVCLYFHFAQHLIYLIVSLFFFLFFIIRFCLLTHPQQHNHKINIIINKWQQKRMKHRHERRWFLYWSIWTQRTLI